METKPTTPADPRAVVRSAASKLHALCEAKKFEEFSQTFEECETRLKTGLFRLVVMGEIKKGKSSFINALLGVDNILPTASDVATSTVFKILYGAEKRYKVFFQPDEESEVRPAPTEIGEGDLSLYGTEDGNPDNQKGVDFIGIELPNPMLQDGLVIIDTPGVGGLYKNHRAITWQYAPRADAVCFVVDSTSSVLTAQEISFLRDLTGKITRRIFFIQTKIDAVDEEHWKSWRVRNSKILVDELGIPEKKLRYFCVSSTLKQKAEQSHDGFDLNESGYLPVLDFLNRGLIASKDAALARDAAIQLKAAALQVRNLISDRKEIFSASSKKQLAKIREELQEETKQFDQWQSSTLQDAVQQFRSKFAQLKREGENRLQEDLDPYGSHVDLLIEKKRNSSSTAKEIVENSEMIIQDVAEGLLILVRKQQSDFNDGYKVLLGQTLEILNGANFKGDSDEVETEGLVSLTDKRRRSQALKVELSGMMSKLQRSSTGGAVGATFASIGVGLVGLLFPPALALQGIAAFAGLVIGGGMATEEVGRKEKGLVLDRLRSELSRVIMKIQRKALTGFRENSMTLEEASNRAIKDMVSRIKAQMTEKMNDLNAAGTMTQDETTTKLREAEAELKLIDSQLLRLEEVISSNNAPATSGEVT